MLHLIYMMLCLRRGKAEKGPNATTLMVPCPISPLLRSANRGAEGSGATRLDHSDDIHCMPKRPGTELKVVCDKGHTHFKYRYTFRLHVAQKL